MTDWRDSLSNEIRELEAQAAGHDPTLATKALHMLRVIRAYELRARQLTLRLDHRLASAIRG